MHKTRKTQINRQTRMIDLIYENHIMLLFLQHFNIGFTVGNKTIKDLCNENNVNIDIFITIGNLYNGYPPVEVYIENISDIKDVLFFLKNSHQFYIKEKCPELKQNLYKLKETHNNKDFILLERFSNEYLDEVLEHLKFEDEIVFPYFSGLLDKKTQNNKEEFSVKKYRSYHTDIETKLTDLKNLFLKHLKTNTGDSNLRLFLNTVFELEFELQTHATIEEAILIPLVQKIEDNNQ